MDEKITGHIYASGGLFTEHFLNSMLKGIDGVDYLDPTTFVDPKDPESDHPSSEMLKTNIDEAFKKLTQRWDEQEQNILDENPDYETVYRNWDRPFLKELGFAPRKMASSVEGSKEITENYFSHRGWAKEPFIPTPPIVHILSPNEDFDIRTSKKQPAPHDAMQQYLNSNQDLWGMLFNGKKLRILRDFYHTTVKGYLEFDVHAIFEERLEDEFRALYMFAHSSRFIPLKLSQKGEAKICLEYYFDNSKSIGETVGKDLRANVVKAIESLGNGFLTPELMNELRSDENKCKEFYSDILRTVYRMIFLLFAEQRGILGGQKDTGQDVYLENYSMTALRDIAMESEQDTYSQEDTHSDVWKGLKATFTLIKDGAEPLGIFPYNGLLFDMSLDKYTNQYDCRNKNLYETIRYLTLTSVKGFQQIISYVDLSVEEIGSIYEGLLDYAPRITLGCEIINDVDYPANSFILDPRGSDRKSTGSYYTPQSLVQQLIKSALEPVIEQKLSDKNSRNEKEKALLSIKICDPACGSAAFLIAACNRLGKELAIVRAGIDVPSQQEIQQAKRDILTHCIYGVDLNPLAVELAKVSLWINAAVKDKPLNFLDHRIKCGNSLIGATPELMKNGIPDTAFKPVDNEDKEIATYFKKINKEQRKSNSLSLSAWSDETGDTSRICSAEFTKLEHFQEDNPDSVHEKQKRYDKLLQSKEFNKEKLLADIWTSAFFWSPMSSKDEIPTHSVFLMGRKNIESVPNKILTIANDIATYYKFFHWYLEFPEVFARKEPGFDCVIGNPPWERINLEEKEFFSCLDSTIANAKTAAIRKNLIRRLKENNPKLMALYNKEYAKVNKTIKFLKNSGKFDYSAKGRLNTYGLFGQLSQEIIGLFGRAGLVLPTGIVTDDNMKLLFQYYMTNNYLVSLFDFENKKGIFPGVHRSYKFALVTLCSSGADIEKALFSFSLTEIEDIVDKDRQISISAEDIKLINPNTMTCPVCLYEKDFLMLKKIYRNNPVLINTDEGNPWNIEVHRMFNTSEDSDLFISSENVGESNFEDICPFYEGKMIYQFNHRFATYEEATVKNINQGKLPESKVESLKDTAYEVQPKFYIEKTEILKRLANKRHRNWFLSFRDVTNNRSSRSTIFSITPLSGSGNECPIIFTQDENILKMLFLLCNFNSIVFDYISRQKIGGNHLNMFILKQLPIIDPSNYSGIIKNIIMKNAIELTYTAWDLEFFGKDILEEIGESKWNEWFPHNTTVEGSTRPFIWDADRRFLLMRELDAIYAHLYDISRDNLDYILETFPIIKRNDIEESGCFRTKELVLEYYDKYTGNLQPVGDE